MKAIILAGGKGTRLKPYTTNFPKPLMPVGDKPILEIVVHQLKDAGIDEIVITTGHMEELIRAFFKNGEKYGIKITYSKEDEPLGTAAPLNLIRDRLTKGTFLVMNGDVLSDIDYGHLITYHQERKKRHQSVATIALSERKVTIDFGVVSIAKDNLFYEWNEKPTINYMVSMGIYLFEPEALLSLPDKGFFNVPDFIIKLQKEGRAVSGYVHKGYWLDIGRPDDYEKACNDYGDKLK